MLFRSPHQSAAYYSSGDPRPGVGNAEQIQGKELSFNNLNDTDAAFELVAEFDAQPAIAIIKHANPCGVAVGDDLVSAYQRALARDTVSAFGGIIAANRTLDGATAEEISKIFTEVIIAPDADEDARAIIAAKKNLRLLIAGGLPDPRARGTLVKSVSGGLLVQSRDNGVVDDLELKVVTRRAPSDGEMADLRFAFRVCKHVKSNAIVLARDGAIVGVGAGQMNRVQSARLAVEQAGHKAKGAVCASDAFFPFPDGVETCLAAGVSAVVEPGGSRKDDDAIAAVDAAGAAMVFSGRRHFRH